MLGGLVLEGCMTALWNPRLELMRDFNESREVGNLRLNGVYCSQEPDVTDEEALVLYFYGDNSYAHLSMANKADLTVPPSAERLKWDSARYKMGYNWGYFRVKGDSVYMSNLIEYNFNIEGHYFKGEALSNGTFVLHDWPRKDKHVLFKFLPASYKPDSSLSPYKRPKYLDKLRKAHSKQSQ